MKDMLKKDIYSLDTFTGLQVSEIQKKTDVESWLHVCSIENVADILTKGAPPASIGPGSWWQSGPAYFVNDPSQWPDTDVKLDSVSHNSLLPFLAPDRKSRVLSSKAQSSKVVYLTELLNITSESFEKLLVQYSCLSKLIRVVAYILRCALSVRKVGDISRDGRTHASCMGITDISQFVKNYVPEISATEYRNAWLVLIYLEQQLRLKATDIKKLCPVKVHVTLATYNRSVEHVVMAGRVSSFPVGFSSDENIPLHKLGVSI